MKAHCTGKGRSAPGQKFRKGKGFLISRIPAEQVKQLKEQQAFAAQLPACTPNLIMTVIILCLFAKEKVTA